MPVEQWDDIRDEFSDALLIGNGASVAIHPEFNYSSLWQKAVEDGHISDELLEIVRELDLGSNFEIILRHLWVASTVNRAFEIDADPIDSAYDELRAALISVVGDIHCGFNDVLPQLRRIGNFCQGFETIFSLNYDFLPYWSFQDSNDRQGEHVFKDCFNNGRLVEGWEDYREPVKGEEHCTLYFYPHGALHLVSDEGGERKLRANGERLLDTAAEAWENDGCLPLFVSEGSNRAKLRAIRRSEYLSRVYNEVLPRSVRTLTVYGWSLSREDNHLLKKIGNGQCDRIAVSVHLPSVPDGDVEGHLREKRRLLRRHGINDIVFYDAQSEGCWAF